MLREQLIIIAHFYIGKAGEKCQYFVPKCVAEYSNYLFFHLGGSGTSCNHNTDILMLLW